MAATIDEPAPILERIASLLLNGLFGLGLIARDQSGKASSLRQGAGSFGSLSFIIASLIEAGQMLAFPFSASQHIWDGTVVRNFVVPMLTVVMPASADVWFGPMVYRVMFFLGIAWVLIFVSLSVSIAVAFIREQKQSEFALRLFRGVAVLSTTALFLPVSSLLFRSYTCDAGSSVKGSTNDWLGAGIPCDNVWRMVGLGVVAVLLVLFFVLASFVAATFVDRRPGSLRWAAKSHGRVAVALLVAKVVLTAIYNVSPVTARGVGTTVTLIVVALGWLVSLYRELPMLRPVANALRAGSAAAFLWASLSLLVAQLMPENNISIVAVMAVPVAAIAGGMLVLTEARRVVNGKLADCASVSHIVLWASARVQEAEQIQHQAEGTPVAIAIERLASTFRLRYVEHVENSAAGGREDERGFITSRLISRLPVWQAAAEATAGASPSPRETRVTGPDTDRHAGQPRNRLDSETSATVQGADAAEQPQSGRARARRRSLLVGKKDLAEGGHPPTPQEAAQGPELEVHATAQVCGLPANGDAEATAKHRLRLLAAAEEAYRTAMKSEASGLALVAAAKFYETFSPNTQQEVDCIAKLKAMQPAPDLAFVVFVRGIELSDSTAAEGGLAAIDRVMFEQMADETRALRATALRSMVELWAHLEQKRPDLWQVLQTGARLDADIVRCDFLFSRMLRLNPESTTILRAYSGFLSGLGFDPVRGMELRNRADRIDEVASRQRVSKVASVSLFSYGASLKGNRQLQLALTDASSPVVTISASSSNRGEIVAVTPAAAKLLLATRAGSLIGQNISTIVPPPFQDFHQHMLDGFGRSITAKSSIVGHEITLPVARRDGTIIACNLTVDESPPDATTMQPRLAAVLHPVPSAHDLVLFTGEADGFRIASASRGALSLFGVDPSTLKDRHIPLTSFLPSLSPSFVPFAGSASGRAEIHALRDAASLADSGTSASAAATPSHAKHRGGGRGAGAGAGSSLLAQVKPDKRGVARVRVAPMLSLKETGLVPLEFQGAPFATVLAGSVQCMRMMGSEVFLLRFVPTRLVIPAGVPLDGSEAEMLVEDHPDAGPRLSMAPSLVSVLGGGATTRQPGSQRDVAPADPDGIMANVQDGQSIDSGGVALSRGSSAGEDAPAARFELPAQDGKPAAASTCEPEGTGSILAESQGSGAKASSAGATPQESKDLPVELLTRHVGFEQEPRVGDGAGDSEITELLSPVAPKRASASSPVAARDRTESSLTDNCGISRTSSGVAFRVGSKSSMRAGSHSLLVQPGRASVTIMTGQANRSALRTGARSSAVGAVSPSAIATDDPASASGVGDSSQHPDGRASALGSSANLFAGAASSCGESSAAGGAAHIGGLLRSVLRRNDSREPETTRIRLVLVLSAVCVILASAGTAIWIDWSRSQFAGRAEGLRMATERMHAFHASWVSAVAVFTNVSKASPFFVAPIEQLHQQVIEATDAMHAASMNLHDAAEVSGPLGAAYDLTEKFEVLEPTEDGARVVSSAKTTAEAENFFFGVLGVLKTLAPSDWLKPTGVHAFATLRLNEVAFRLALEKSLGHRERDFALLLPEAAQQIIIAGSAFLVGVILTSLVAITIAVTGLWRHSVSTMQLFLSFPAEVSGSLRQLATIQLEAADADGAAGLGDWDEEDSGEPDEDQPEVGGPDDVSPQIGGLGATKQTGSKRGLGAELRGDTGPNEDGETDAAMRNQVINEADATARWEAALHSLRAARRGKGRRTLRALSGPDRSFKVTNGFVISSLFWLLLPVAMIGGWLATLVLVSVASYQRSSGQANRILQASHVASHVDELEMYCNLAISDDAIMTKLMKDPDWRSSVMKDAMHAEVSLTEKMDGLIFGGVTCSAIGHCELLEPLRQGEGVVAPQSAALFLRDACIGAPQEQLDVCHSTLGGALASGLLAASSRITTYARLFFESRTSTNWTVPPPADIRRIERLAQVVNPHMRASLKRARVDLIDSTLEVLVQGQSLALTATWVFALVYLGITAIWLSSQVSQLAWPLRTARRLVRFLPSELVLAVPTLRHGLREVASGLSVTSGSSKRCCSGLACSRRSSSARKVAIQTPASGRAGSSGRSSS
ncbi:hypothetical protein FNF29_02088 [Cafeteria roenbergensis]|uniref:TmcB/TmcC TPR repeats domain-containing protein n=1 Tax=Cafeteria roenbergensis TaxID=33653 RepID=A0A5A8CR55_CAFRO|nr:hypothetical protein FNF29_02088 [Cafeteria roenbergensis]KAA0170183.1 hypothetical protein FNF28_01604 [Cafeteria roenbergensis]|eukprot:KAA0154944.1 hypothetical protein FNF29_02088 [Cafeteria roenbergensis]